MFDFCSGRMSLSTPGHKIHGAPSSAFLWPGRTMAKFGNGNGYAGNIDGQDISGYDDKTKALYNSIKSAEYSEAKYGTGLYLISSTMAGTTEPNTQGSGNYWLALKAAAYDNSTFGASDRYSWLGTVTDNDLAWFVSWNGDISDHSQDNAYVIAPAFNLDTSKVSLKGNALTVK